MLFVVVKNPFTVKNCFQWELIFFQGEKRKEEKEKIAYTISKANRHFFINQVP